MQRTGRRLVAGHRLNIGRITGWVTELGQPKSTACRTAVLGAVGVVGWQTIERSPAILWVLTGAWTIAAWRTAKPAPADEEGFADTETPEAVSTTVDTPPPDPSAVFARWLVQLIGQRPGIHLAELYPAMRQLDFMHGHDDAALRSVLRELRIPITRSLRIGTVEGRSGVRLADLAPLLPRDGEEPLSTDGDAGQTADSPPGEQPESRGERAGERVESA
ncbi:hypothetical protein ACWGDX_24105 [Streptomyces sp. NPDC055025]